VNNIGGKSKISLKSLHALSDVIADDGAISRSNAEED
jgi:hypothetical protein